MSLSKGLGPTQPSMLLDKLFFNLDGWVGCQTFTPPSMYYVYIMKHKNGEWYIGYTNDLKRRIDEHQKEERCILVYYEAYTSDKLARTRERKLKYYGSAWRALKKRINA